MRPGAVSIDRDLMTMRSDTVSGIVAGLLLAVVAMTLVLALASAPSQPSGDAAYAKGGASASTREAARPGNARGRCP